MGLHSNSLTEAHRRFAVAAFEEGLAVRYNVATDEIELKTENSRAVLPMEIFDGLPWEPEWFMSEIVIAWRAIMPGQGTVKFSVSKATTTAKGEREWKVRAQWAIGSGT